MTSTGTERQAHLADLLERARAGEAGALDDIVRELTPLLWHVTRAQGLDAADAADAVQTTWLELLRALHEIRSPHALTAWLVTAAKRESWRVQRQRRQTVAADTDDEQPDPRPEAAEHLIADERRRLLWNHVQALPGRCRELLRIVAMVDRPDYTQVAAALGMPHGSIGPTRGRCLTKLRDALLADPRWSR
ncbi:sigma-70 family RNA polymerase sigma factor [Catellatospora sp. NPDC049133]|jgi:RNA polymerase sigma factor (sigma-70 family)|uniref:RNA polymerase sigma factor n=1 Tax=Catellatospora sp. NPDC049133 TaxID=3155499 RepID=UPI0033F97540